MCRNCIENTYAIWKSIMKMLFERYSESLICFLFVCIKCRSILLYTNPNVRFL